ncbi:hypothetical protein [Pseudomonas sp. SCB32]|uniref:hypothetical protein n=1 Tax=Pseudomonas sp. SCB32 TaxID=2653853 RepID=UPI001265A873|nr:hypothetical protein [Pseudomonas sp. SCB32]
MTQSHIASRPLPSGPGHRVKLIPLAVHHASATCWGRPWRRRALSLPATRELTFKGIRLPPQALRSWLHLLAKTGLMFRRPAAVSTLIKPEEPDASPTIAGLGFELCTEMILDFAQVARLSRQRVADEQAEAHSGETSDDSGQDQEVPSVASETDLNEPVELGLPDTVPPDSVDLDFLQHHLANASSDAGKVPAEPELPGLVGLVKSPATAAEPVEQLVAQAKAFHETRGAAVPSLVVTADLVTADTAEQPVSEGVELIQRQEAEMSTEVLLDGAVAADVVEQPVSQAMERSVPQETEVPVAVAMGETASAGVVELPAVESMAIAEPQVAEKPATVLMDEPVAADVEQPTSQAMERSAPQEEEVPVVAVTDEAASAGVVELPAAESMAIAEPQVAEEPATVLMDEPVAADSEQPASQAMELSVPQEEEVPVVAVTDEAASAGVVELPAAESMAVAEPQVAAEPATALMDEPVAADVVDQPVSMEISPHQQAEVPSVVVLDEPISEGVVEQSVSEAQELPAPAAMAFAQPREVDVPSIDLQCVIAEQDQVKELEMTEPVALDQAQGSIPDADAASAYELLEALASSLAEASHATVIDTAAAHASDEPAFAPAARTQDGWEAANSNLEAAVLQGILIHKESAMTELHDVLPETDMPPGASVPITSAELQEVAAALSVPQLDADPDDVLSDVQSTLNSLAGMAQGLSQQKQAAGRLQEELDEWSNQLLERERLAGDKEEHLLQLESHLKEAKANLDRMASENTRLLAERSEALKDLAQTVDLRDKATAKRAESIQIEQQRIDEQSANLRARASELDERESSLKRKSEELGVRLKQLQSAKDKFSTIVKSFNETVQFNSTLSAISKTVVE